MWLFGNLSDWATTTTASAEALQEILINCLPKVLCESKAASQQSNLDRIWIKSCLAKPQLFNVGINKDGQLLANKGLIL